MINKHLEIKTYDYCGVKVTVKIDYDKGELSLLERDFTDKKWLFVKRGLEYMNGWLEVFEAMKYAVERAKDELVAYNEAKRKEMEDNVTDALEIASGLIKKGLAKEGKKLVSRK